MLVLATVGVPPVTATAPPLMRIVPAASRLSVMVLSRLSPKAVRTCADGLKVAVMAIVIPLERLLAVEENDAVAALCTHDEFVIPWTDVRHGESARQPVAEETAGFCGDTLFPREQTKQKAR